MMPYIVPARAEKFRENRGRGRYALCGARMVFFETGVRQSAPVNKHHNTFNYYT
jgi:hypothetical protein